LSRARTVAWGARPRIMQGWAVDDTVSKTESIWRRYGLWGSMLRRQS
jgi:hypothetical protein